MLPNHVVQSKSKNPRRDWQSGMSTVIDNPELFSSNKTSFDSTSFVFRLFFTRKLFLFGIKTSCNRKGYLVKHYQNRECSLINKLFEDNFIHLRRKYIFLTVLILWSCSIKNFLKPLFHSERVHFKY